MTTNIESRDDDYPQSGVAERVIPDYGAMSDPDLLSALGDDGSLWAAAFCQIAKKHGHDIDEGWMIGWFANAIEGSWAKRMRRAGPETRPLLQPVSFATNCPYCDAAPQQEHDANCGSRHIEPIRR